MNKMRTQPHGTDRLLEQSATVGADLRELGHVTKEVAQEGLSDIRDAAAGYLEQGRRKVGDMGKQAENYVVQRPLKSLAVVAAAGIALGWLFARRR